MVVSLLKKLRVNDFSVTLTTDNKLKVSGPNNPDLIQEIRDNKALLIEALRNAPKGIDQLENRLTTGMAWLVKAFNTTHETPKLIDAFARNLHGWADLEGILRHSYPEYEGCPIGGCDSKQPVVCSDCERRTILK